MSVKIPVNKLFTKAAADGKITQKEAQQIAKAVQKGGVTKNEQAALKANLALHADSFQSGARAPLNKLAGGSAPAATPGTGLTADQRKLLADAGVKPGSPEGKVMVAQMLMANLAKSGGGAPSSGYGLSAAQQNVFKQAGLDPNSEEGRMMKLQMMLGNAKRLGPISPALLDQLFKQTGVDPNSQEGRVMKAQVLMANQAQGGAGSNPTGDFGLTAAQQKILSDAGVDPNSEEGRSMKLQMMLGNAAKNGPISTAQLNKILADAGVDPNSAEARQIKAQHAMSTSQAVQGSPGGSGGVAPTSSGGGGGSSNIVGSIAGAVPNGYGLTAAQQKIFQDAGVDPGSEEGKSMKLQMMMANYKNNMEMVSNISKMLSELGSSIIRNIRA